MSLLILLFAPVVQSQAWTPTACINQADCEQQHPLEASVCCSRPINLDLFFTPEEPKCYKLASLPNLVCAPGITDFHNMKFCHNGHVRGTDWRNCEKCPLGSYNSVWQPRFPDPKKPGSGNPCIPRQRGFPLVFTVRAGNPQAYPSLGESGAACEGIMEYDERFNECQLHKCSAGHFAFFNRLVNGVPDIVCKTPTKGHQVVDGREVPCYHGTCAENDNDRCTPCDAGFYTLKTGCLNFKLGCLKTKPGEEVVDGTVKRCRPGYFQDEEGLESCKMCREGTYQMGNGRHECVTVEAGQRPLKDDDGAPFGREACPVGTYSPGAQDHCIPCAHGHYAQAPGQHSCEPVGKGSYILTNVDGMRVGHALCEAGTYQNIDNFVIPRLNLAEPVDGPDFCKVCPTGHYQETPGQQACSCVGWGQKASTDRKRQEPCQAGFYSAGCGSGGCKPCELGTYSHTEGSPQCSPVPEGHCGPFRMLQQPVMCVPDTYQNKRGQTVCLKCGIGYWSKAKSTVCSSCFTPAVLLPAMMGDGPNGDSCIQVVRTAAAVGVTLLILLLCSLAWVCVKVCT